MLADIIKIYLEENLKTSLSIDKLNQIRKISPISFGI